jgi:protein TonB
VKTALSLYVAIAAHLLILLGLALGSGGWSQLPFGIGQGLGDGTPEQAAPLASEADAPAAAELSKPEPQQIVGSDVLRLASKPVPLTSPAQRVAVARPLAPVASSRNEEKRAPAAPTTSRGSGPAGGGRGGYLADLRRHLDRHRRSLPGVLASARSEVAFTVAADGSVSALRLQKSSGVAALDQEALDLLRRAAPLPKPPDGLARELVVPVSVGAP